MIRLVVALLFRRPRPSRGGAAPSPLPQPERGSMAWQIDHAHRITTDTRRDLGRWRRNQPNAPDLLAIAEEAEHAAMHLVFGAQAMRDAAEAVTEIDADIDDLLGGA